MLGNSRCVRWLKPKREACLDGEASIEYVVRLSGVPAQLNLNSGMAREMKNGLTMTMQRPWTLYRTSNLVSTRPSQEIRAAQVWDLRRTGSTNIKYSVLQK